MRKLLEQFEVRDLEECIIVAARLGGDIVFAKNRDRMYVPDVRIVHEIRDGVEVAYIEDMVTGWREGMNEFGIGVVNTALMVASDEKEKTMVKKTGDKSKEGFKILTALKQRSLKRAVDSLVRDKVLGHTFVGDANNVFLIEGTSQHKGAVEKLNYEKVIVRTNHGNTYPDAGYTAGDDYFSSQIRKVSAEHAAESAVSAQDMLRLMRKNNYNQVSKGHLNMTRETNKMNTTSQLAMDLSALKMYFNGIRGKVNFKGVDEDIPDGYRTKIEIIVTELRTSNRTE